MPFGDPGGGLDPKSLCVGCVVLHFNGMTKYIQILDVWWYPKGIVLERLEIVVNEHLEYIAIVLGPSSKSTEFDQAKRETHSL